jgi:di/tricarboxylate transporter
MYALLAFALAAGGAGSIAATALMAPMAMAVAQRVGISPFLMTIMVAHGALAGAISPFGPTGIIANNLIREKMGLSNFEVQTFGYNMLANTVVALGGYLAFGGLRLFSRPPVDDRSIETTIGQNPPTATGQGNSSAGLELRHQATLGVIGALIAAVMMGGCHIGMGAFAGGIVLTLAGFSDEKEAIRSVPWGVIMMVCGVTMLTSLLERTGGIDRFAELVGRVSTSGTIAPILAFVTGTVSVYSSTSGVVLPAFLPMVPKLLAQFDDADALKLALSIIVGGNLVDSSPLSTIGALCIASAPLTADRRVLFNKVLIWGFAMAVIGAGLCYLMFGGS